MKLTSQQTRRLRQLAHHLKPVVMIGDKGVSDNVLAEIDRALETHELIKVRISADKTQKRAMTEKISQTSGAQIVQLIGNISILYRASDKPKIMI
jgi:RNA-binding protein